MEKKCTKCGQTKPLDADHFYRHKHKAWRRNVETGVYHEVQDKERWHAACKVCHNEAVKRRRANWVANATAEELLEFYERQAAACKRYRERQKERELEELGPEAW